MLQFCKYMHKYTYLHYWSIARVDMPRFAFQTLDFLP